MLKILTQDENSIFNYDDVNLGINIDHLTNMFRIFIFSEDMGMKLIVGNYLTSNQAQNVLKEITELWKKSYKTNSYYEMPKA